MIQEIVSAWSPTARQALRQRVLDLLQGAEAVGLDALRSETGAGEAALFRELKHLEAAGRVERLIPLYAPIKARTHFRLVRATDDKYLWEQTFR